jgi:protein ImuB
MLWAALLPERLPADTLARTEALTALASWCLQFTPRVALVEPDGPLPCVVMEVEASQRLFGGKRRLVERVKQEAGDLGVQQLSWAPTSLAAVALARSGRSNGFAKPLDEVLDALPLECLTAVQAHRATLARLGCRTLGQLRALPRGGLSRRFDGELLAALDQAYGLRPEAHAWVVLPETFKARLELMARVELAPALLFGARRLLLQMSGWLAARHAGVSTFTLSWCHDVMRSRSAGDGGQLNVRTATATRDIEHLTRLVAEYLAKVELLAPVGDLALVADEVHALEEKSASLLPDTQAAGESLALLIERIAARLGPQSVLRPVVLEDHRIEWMCHWQPAPEPRPRKRARTVPWPQPSFILPEPLRLMTRDHRPIYPGVLQLLVGPHRVEGGWWDRTVEEGEARTRNVVRDYWVALSEHAGVLWIYQTRLADDETAWFLHGTFA